MVELAKQGSVKRRVWDARTMGPSETQHTCPQNVGRTANHESFSTTHTVSLWAKRYGVYLSGTDALAQQDSRRPISSRVSASKLPPPRQRILESWREPFWPSP